VADLIPSSEPGKPNPFLPPFPAEAVDLRGVPLTAAQVDRIIENERTGSLPGLISGTILVLFGIGATVAGLSGSMDLVVAVHNFSSRLTNATPGVFCVVAGVVLLLLSKPTVKVSGK